MSKKIYFLIVIVAVFGLALFLMPADRREVYDAMKEVPVIISPDLSRPITSPLVISGQARGPWYFEGSFPIELLDDSDNLLAQGIATAQGEWMTEEYVPFTAELTFVTPAEGGAGTLVLRKDNPSGLPENDGEMRIPVRFGEVSTRNAEFNSEISLGIGDRITFSDSLVILLQEIDDSRCQPDVQCIWAGELSPLLIVGKAQSEVRLGTVNNQSVTFGNYTFMLIKATEETATIKVLRNL